MSNLVFNWQKHNAKIEARRRMRGTKQVTLRPLKAYVLRVWLEPSDYYPTHGDRSFEFTYIQQGRQWRGSLWAKDELAAYIEAKKGLRMNDFYLGRSYYRVR